MGLKFYTSSLIALVLLSFATSVRADTYSTYQTTRYYSANRQYFVEVDEKRLATMYLNERKLKRVWTRTLPELPGDVVVSNNGSRAAMIDSYYGNGRKPEKTAVLILDEKGQDLATYSLGEVANLQRVLHTTSSSRWYWGAGFTADGQFLIVQTSSKKCERPEQIKSEADLALADECDRILPYERLRFDVATGKMIERSPFVRAALR